MNLIEELGGAKARHKSRTGVAGVGYNTSNMPTKVNGKHTPEYVMWREMLRRCYSAEFKSRFPCYDGCVVAVEWHDFKNFHGDLIKMTGYENIHLGRSYNLDKDLLLKGNKIYSKETCSIVPQEINKLITSRKSKRGKYPVGVHFSSSKGKFVVQISLDGKNNLHVGYFNDENSAFLAYKSAKESRIKELAEKHKNCISESVYLALINYEVSEND